MHSSRPHAGRASELYGIGHVTENATSSNFSNQGWKYMEVSLRSRHKGLPRLAALDFTTRMQEKGICQDWGEEIIRDWA